MKFYEIFPRTTNCTRMVSKTNERRSEILQQLSTHQNWCHREETEVIRKDSVTQKLL